MSESRSADPVTPVTAEPPGAPIGFVEFVLLIAALPTQLEALAALGVFAPMSILSMAALTGAFAWILTRPVIEPVYRNVLIPVLGLFGLVFGLWYTGIT